MAKAHDRLLQLLHTDFIENHHVLVYNYLETKYLFW